MGFVVEGLNDERKMKEVMPDAHCVVTNGTRMNNRVRMDLRQALEECDVVYLLTDPDDAGDTLAQMVWRECPSLERVLLDRSQCLSYRYDKLKVGVEHAQEDYLKSVLSQYVDELQMVL